MRKLSILVTAALAAALTATASAEPRPQAAPGAEEGFFRPSPDPALTSIGPTPVPAESRADARVPAVAAEFRKAEEERMDRAEAAARALAEAPVITSPLDGTAPIMSPLDGSAPIVSPLGR